MKLAVVLLAGGESRRMGTDKASLPFQGRPLWEIQLELLRKLNPAEIFVSARSDPPWRTPDIDFVADESPSGGPISGLTAALTRTRQSHLLALAIDMPFMTEERLRATWNLAEPHCGVLPMIGRRAEPLAAVYPVEAAPGFGIALSRGDFSLQSLTTQLVAAGKLRVMRVTKNDEKFYQNLNQPSDLMVRPRRANEKRAGN